MTDSILLNWNHLTRELQEWQSLGNWAGSSGTDGFLYSQFIEQIPQFQ